MFLVKDHVHELFHVNRGGYCCQFWGRSFEEEDEESTLLQISILHITQYGNTVYIGIAMVHPN